VTLPQVLPKVGVELQSSPEDTDVARDEYVGDDAQTKVEAKYGVTEQVKEWNDCFLNKKEEVENFAEPTGEQKDVEPVDKTVANNSTLRMDRIDNQVRNTGLRTVRSLVNGGLAILALGALSPVGLLLKHLEGLKEEEGGGEERTGDDNDL
jgi:hypothetical protein